MNARCLNVPKGRRRSPEDAAPRRRNDRLKRRRRFRADGTSLGFRRKGPFVQPSVQVNDIKGGERARPQGKRDEPARRGSCTSVEINEFRFDESRGPSLSQRINLETSRRGTL